MSHAERLDTPRVAFARGDDIPSHVRRFASESPDRTALIAGGERRSYAEYAAQIERVAQYLAGLGIGRGGRVAVLATNSIAYAEAFVGTLAADASIVPLPTMASEESLALMLEDCAAAILFSDEKHEAIAARLAGRRGIRHASLDFTDASLSDLGGTGSGVAGNPPSLARAPLPEIAGHDEFDVIYSSGTTGVPKGIVHDHAIRKASYAGSRAAYFSAAAVNIVATPFYSNTTCITWLLTTAAGGTNVILGKFTPEAFFDAVAAHGGTHSMLVPTQYDRLFGSEKYRAANLSTLTHLFSTSSPLRAETKQRVLRELTAELVEIYGLTEGGPTTILEARRHPDKLATVGLPAAGCEIRIVDDDGMDVPRGQAGEVIGRSASMTTGYLNRPEDTAALAFRDRAGNLFFRSGDYGRFDADGFLQLLDRKKDVIISGGFNVYATDIEVVLAAHPDVADVAVIAVPSEKWGETPLALVVVKEGSTTTEGALVAYCNERLGKAQRVSAVEFRSELPKNAIGKTMKRDLRAPYWDVTAKPGNRR